MDTSAIKELFEYAIDHLINEKRLPMEFKDSNGVIHGADKLSNVYESYSIFTLANSIDVLAKDSPRAISNEEGLEFIDEATYLAQEGNICINANCKEEPELTGDSVQTDSSGAWQIISCDNCNCSWTDEYKLVGFSVSA